MVPFSGLAPLTVGYYQVDLQLPVALAPGNHDVRCFLPAIDPQRLIGAFVQVPRAVTDFWQAHRMRSGAARHVQVSWTYDVLGLCAF